MSRKFNFNSNQLALPFGQRRAMTISFEDRQRFFYFLAITSLLSLFVYFYAINATAHHLAVRQNLEKEVAEAAGELGSLEFAHIELRNAVTMETAHEYGFEEVKEPLYVSRAPASTLTLNTVTR